MISARLASVSWNLRDGVRWRENSHHGGTRRGSRLLFWRGRKRFRRSLWILSKKSSIGDHRAIDLALVRKGALNDNVLRGVAQGERVRVVGEVGTGLPSRP